MGNKGASSGKGAGGGAKYEEVNDDSFFDKSVDKWKSDISESEFKASRLYTTGNFEPWNNALRNDNGKGWEEQTKNLDSSLSKFNLEKNIVVYRGLGYGALEELFGSENIDVDALNKMKGSIISDKGFLSTSISKDVATNFSSPKCLLRISVPKGKGRGAYVSSVSHYEEELEFVMPRNTNLKITSAYKDDMNRTIIEAKYVK